MNREAHPADWMHDGTFGVMVHYLITPPGETREERSAAFNRTVDGFDLDHFIGQVVSTGADWLIFTIGQNTGYYCSPNAFLDAALPGHTSRRDLLLEIAERIDAAGKRFIAYLPAEIAQQSDEMRAAFGRDAGEISVFQERCESFVRDYALKLGPLLDGWWYDGCWIEPERFGDWTSWMAASRAGNLEAIVAVSPGPSEEPMTPRQDYLAGETYELPPPHLPASRFVGDRVQWHALLPVDSNFVGGPPCVYDDETLFGWVMRCKSVGGAVTLNVPIGKDGVIPGKSVEQLRRLGRTLVK